MQRRIINKESFSSGKKQRGNDDDIYVGKDFAAVIDGVSNKNSILVDGKTLRISQIITEAIRKMDRPGAPVYAKALSFEECVKFINLYIKEYLQRHGVGEAAGKLEATGVIYSRFHNQIWIVGDCRAIYDGNVVQNPLKIDETVIDIRRKIVEGLLKEGYTEKQLMESDVSKTIMKHSKSLPKHIKNPQIIEDIEEYITQKIKRALIEGGFSEEEIEEQNLIKRYYNPRDIQKLAKNNPNMGNLGYSVFNGQNTEIRNCRVVTLPNDVKTIKLFSDGFPIDALNNDKGIGYAVRTIRRRAKADLLSIKTNPATHVASRYSKSLNRLEEYAIDDASAVIIEIVRDEKETGER